MQSTRSLLRLFLPTALACTFCWAQEPALVVESPMAPPTWALLEQQLLKFNSLAVERFADRFIDEKGYLLHTPRWGTLDGPDDAIETYFNWTLLYAMGGSDKVMQLYRRGYEGHMKQYNELRTKLTTLGENGAYHKEFITQSDWFHTAEGMRAVLLAGLADPEDQVYVQRMKRFAAMYMAEDPDAPNYDPVNKVIKSIWTGSKGPMLRKATTYDWVGDPVPGVYHLLHNPAGRGKMLDMNTYYPKMLAHCQEYLDSVGDNNLNLASTILGVNSFLLTGDEKYRKWVVDYVDAWKQRTELTGGNIPSNVGLNGKPGGEYNGQWWKGTYGWNFTIFDGELEKIAHRNYFSEGSWSGFSNALLMTGDQSYVQVLRRQMQNIMAEKKVENGVTLYPQMYGDPRGYKFNGPPSWYHFTENLRTDRLTEIYLWSMDRKDLAPIPLQPNWSPKIPEGGGYSGPDRGAAWLAYLEGQSPDFPEKALRADLESVREKIEMIRTDQTTADTRLADYLLDLTPAATQALTNLTMGAYFPKGRVWVLHSRVRYFDPIKRRPGLPEDVGALVEKFDATSTTLTLVNTNPIEDREIIVQGGAYGEHQINTVSTQGKSIPISGRSFRVLLKPGCGAKFTLQVARYKNTPSLQFPWKQNLIAAK